MVLCHRLVAQTKVQESRPAVAVHTNLAFSWTATGAHATRRLNVPWCAPNRPIFCWQMCSLDIFLNTFFVSLEDFKERGGLLWSRGWSDLRTFVTSDAVTFKLLFLVLLRIWKAFISLNVLTECITFHWNILVHHNHVIQPHTGSENIWSLTVHSNSCQSTTQCTEPLLTHLDHEPFGCLMKELNIFFLCPFC